MAVPGLNSIESPPDPSPDWYSLSQERQLEDKYLTYWQQVDWHSFNIAVSFGIVLPKIPHLTIVVN